MQKDPKELIWIMDRVQILKEVVSSIYPDDRK